MDGNYNYNEHKLEMNQLRTFHLSGTTDYVYSGIVHLRKYIR